MKIMVWNIEKFTDNKFYDYEYTPHSTVGAKRKRAYHPAVDRQFYMEQVVSASSAAGSTPDVIAVLETMIYRPTALDAPMALLESTGVLSFLATIKAATGNPAWRVVPPIKCNPQRPLGHVGRWAAEEAVAVFYNSATVTFAGPDYWNGAAVQRAALGAAAYPAPWNGATITGGTTRSGRVMHTTAGNVAITFPHDMNRRPFMVDFVEVGGAARLFRCLFIHTSPQHGIGGTHVQGMAAIATIADMNPAQNVTAAPNYFVACGDFNVNDYNALERAAGYNPLMALGYAPMLSVANTSSTHFRRNPDATPLAAPFSYKHHEIIDNFFVLKNPPLPAAVVAPTSSPIDGVAGAPAPWAGVMGQTMGAINAIVAGAGVPGPTATFRQWPNFWSIIATSDHLPIYLRIP